MRHHDTDTKNPNVVMGGAGAKGVHMFRSPYLWRENNPVHPYADTPCENFVPTPVMETHEDSKLKKGIKIALLVVLAAFVVYGTVSILMGGADAWGLGEIAKRQFY